MNMLDGGFAFVFTHINVLGELPVELPVNHVFRKANEQEIEIIRDRFRACWSNPFQMKLPYEIDIREEPTENGATYHDTPLTEENWKYYVVAYEGESNIELRNFECAARLLVNDLEFGFEAHHFSGGGTGHSPIQNHLIERVSMFPFSVAPDVQSSEIGMMGHYHGLIKALPKDDRYHFLRHALDNYHALRVVPWSSELVVVGYFSIIEALITHAPRQKESLDSIMHQVKNKLTLLSKRFARQIDRGDYFGEAGEQKIWGLLYSYRSAIAHGTKPNFGRDLQVLQKHAAVISYLKEVVKELLILGLNEPDFLADLKNC